MQLNALPTESDALRSPAELVAEWMAKALQLDLSTREGQADVKSESNSDAKTSCIFHDEPPYRDLQSPDMPTIEKAWRRYLIPLFLEG